MFTFGLTVLALASAPAALAMNVSNVLIYSMTAGFRHDSIPTAITSMTQRGPAYGINFVNTEDMTLIRNDYLSQFDAVFFLSNTEDVLDDAGKLAFQHYLDVGGNVVGVHAATNCMLHWPTMTRTLGSQFAYHPEFTNATMIILDPAHSSTAGLPPRWKVQDEIYNFVQDPRSFGAKVVVAADETSYVDTGDRSPGQGSPHPISWYQERVAGTNSTGAGRMWYTGLGHADAAWKDDVFMSHIFGGLSYVLSSNTTRNMNPSATVGSLGPSWTPPPPAPTTTADIEGHSSAVRVVGGLSLIGSTLMLSALWVLHVL